MVSIHSSRWHWSGRRRICLLDNTFHWWDWAMRNSHSRHSGFSRRIRRAFSNPLNPCNCVHRTGIVDYSLLLGQPHNHFYHLSHLLSMLFFISCQDLPKFLLVFSICSIQAIISSTMVLSRCKLYSFVKRTNQEFKLNGTVKI